MSIQAQITRLENNVNNALSAIADKGVTVPSNANSDNLSTLIESISSGIDTSDATATAGDIMSGKTAYADGQKVTGNFSLDSELSAQDELISQIMTALEGKAAGGGTGDAVEDLDVELTEQENLIAQLSTILDSKANGSPQTTAVTYTGRGTTEAIWYTAYTGTSFYTHSYFSSNIGSAIESLVLRDVVIGTSVIILFSESEGITGTNIEEVAPSGTINVIEAIIEGDNATITVMQY